MGPQNERFVGEMDDRRSGEGIVKHVLTSVLTIALIVGLSSAARAQKEVTLLTPGSMREAMAKVIAAYEMKTGNKVKVTFAGGLTTRATVAKGEGADVTLVIPPYWAALASGNIDRSTITTVVSTVLAVVVPHGAPHPDISSPAAFKKALLEAKSIGYSDPDFSSSGVAVANVLAKMNIEDQIVAKSHVYMSDVTTRQDLNSGKLALAMLYISDIHRPSDEFDVVGPLPRKVATPNPMIGFVTTKAKDPAAAKGLLQFMTSPEAQAIFKEWQFETKGAKAD
jgi:molybdenum ABC transporter molybdate-binding protein